jgi:SAM-dependent methyltransferase
MAEPVRYDPAFFEALRALEAGSFWFRARNAMVMEAIERHFPLARDFAEIGCGTGFVLEGLAAGRPGLRLTGADAFSRGLAFARGRVSGARFVRADARSLPFREAFDAVGAFDVLEHIDDDEAVLVEMAGAVKPGGGLLLTVPQHPRLWSPADEQAGHVRRYSRKELIGKVRGAGFEVVAVTGFVSLLLPALAALRLAKKRRPAGASLAGLALPRALDAFLGAVMALERRVILGGFSFPFGGSLFLAARRK